MNSTALLVGLLSMLAHSVWAATFDQVLQSALASHPEIMGKRSAQAAAQADREGARWQRYPTPSIDANSRNDSASPDVLRLEQPLWTGGRITAGIAAADSRLDAAGMAISEARRDIALKVIAAAGEAVRQRARQELYQSSVEQHEKLLAMIHRRVEQEVSPLADQRLAQSRLYSTKNDLSAATQAWRNALAQLGQLSGMTVQEIESTGFTQAADPTGLSDDLESMSARALAQSPTLARVKFEAEAANADIDSKRAAYLPQLSLRLENSHIGGTIPDNRAMLVFQAQPGAGLSAGSGVTAALARREAARQATDAAERDVRQQLNLDWNEWTAASARMENAEQVRSTSAEVSESYARQYTAGRKTWLDVMNAVREATQANLALVDARSQMQAAALRLKAQVGRLEIYSSFWNQP